ncbi:hypothetical protein D8O03_13135, partial [Burkholderia mallei]
MRKWGGRTREAAGGLPRAERASAHRHINEDNAAARRFRGWPCASREVALAARRGTRFRPSQHA